MAKTYDRIRVLLEEVKRNQALGTDRRDLDSLVSNLASRKIKEFLLDSEDQRYMSPRSLERLLKLLADVKLVEITDGTIRLNASGRNALQGDNYDRTVSTLVLEYLSGRDINLTAIYDAIDAIQLPEVPEVATVFENISSTRKDEVGEERFRTLLYLLACTGRLGRDIKVIYGRRGNKR